MKKIIGIVIASLVFCNIGFAEVRLIEKTKVGDHRIYTWCIDGHKFVAFDRMHKDGGASMVQFWNKEPGYKPVPANC